jgi:hypothetical protein
MIETCELCHTADDVTLAPGGGSLICTNAKKHPTGASHTWPKPPPPVAKKPSTGGTPATDTKKTENLIDPFKTIIHQFPKIWIEHGVLEYQLRLQYPDVFGEHVAAWGHQMLERTHDTASNRRFSIALKRIAAEGLLQKKEGKGTGAWDYLPTVSYWALKPVQPGTPDLTWAQYAKQLERPTRWTDEDRAEVRRLSGREVGG